MADEYCEFFSVPLPIPSGSAARGGDAAQSGGHSAAVRGCRVSWRAASEHGPASANQLADRPPGLAAVCRLLLAPLHTVQRCQFDGTAGADSAVLHYAAAGESKLAIFQLV